MTPPLDLDGLVAGWPVGFVSAAVVRPDGVVAATGDIARRARIASISKPIAAVATLIAVEDGSISLDDVTGPGDATVRHLLNHTSGLSFDQPTATGPVGRRRMYSNVGFDRLGDHLATATGIDIADYLTEAVFVPLGMTGSGLHGSPAADVVSNVDDLTRFAAELLRPTLLHPSTLATATTPVMDDLAGVLPGVGRFDPLTWGLGFEVRGSKTPHWSGTLTSPRLYGHFGGSGTLLWVEPDLDTALVVITDRPFDQWALEVWPPLGDAVVAWARTLG